MRNVNKYDQLEPCELIFSNYLKFNGKGKKNTILFLKESTTSYTNKIK